MTQQLIIELVREIIVLIIDLIKKRKQINTQAEIQNEYANVVKTFKVQSKVARQKVKEITLGKWKD